MTPEALCGIIFGAVTAILGIAAMVQNHFLRPVKG